MNNNNKDMQEEEKKLAAKWSSRIVRGDNRHHHHQPRQLIPLVLDPIAIHRLSVQHQGVAVVVVVRETAVVAVARKQLCTTEMWTHWNKTETAITTVDS